MAAMAATGTNATLGNVRFAAGYESEADIRLGDWSRFFVTVGSIRSMGKLHNKARWHRIARHQLRVEPLCRMCLAEGRVVAARVADHVEPHHNDPVKFWTGKLQSLCSHCHESRKKSAEHRGYDRTIGPDGLPIDPRHPVYRNSS